MLSDIEIGFQDFFVGRDVGDLGHLQPRMIMAGQSARVGVDLYSIDAGSVQGNIIAVNDKCVFFFPASEGSLQAAKEVHKAIIYASVDNIIDCFSLLLEELTIRGSEYGQALLLRLFALMVSGKN